ncbi:nucleotidyltransferase-like protein [Balneicella halophila]|uniref:Nucleotidyltransferase-like protein n=1 Tax=Balneicella halophila TaxID=1537566 RepID=A0A7L4UTR5_BALHA|nr:sugar phosphate nucleotidyltransferase [Balneicella halophila]PVX52644.1 nucleotidyltransferase-like protein [Balneicella halophila]
MTKPTLLILAAGMGSRYGGLKQMDGLGPSGETIIDYSIYDAIRAGFGKVVFVIRESFKEEFKKSFDKKLSGKVDIDYVCQELTDIPKGTKLNPERKKPWGTGHAVLVAKDSIKEPFAVINADDYYGIKAFEQMHHFLTEEVTPNSCAIMGYELGKTLSENGTVSRGVCSINEHNQLTEIHERTAIERNVNGQIVWKDEAGKELPLDAITPVSMNFWGFHPSIFELAQPKFIKFINEKGLELKSEFYIPFMVDELRKEGKMEAVVIPIDSEWFGVTYQADREPTVAKIQQLVDDNIYPENLWK